jgi:uncharacterized protein
MTTPPPIPDLLVRKVRGMGRGVFAGRPFAKREVIEVCPILRLPTDTPGVGTEDYVFRWGRLGSELAIALGYGSLYNHSPAPNAEFTARFGRSDIVFRALRDIAAGEQILIDYQWEEAEYAGFARAATPPVPPTGS